MTKTIYKNKNTGKVAEYLKSEIVSDAVYSVRVHTLFYDGKEVRWNSDQFSDVWIFVSGKKV